ncbi:MAG: hypothetical protein JWR21_3763 [Herminiimonas sp.]|nr:hypothetical protein [Herminiimonas sp.]
MSVTLWDDERAPVGVADRVLYWRGHSEGSCATSVPRHLEYHADRLRMRYIEFIHDLGEHRIAGKRVVEHLALQDGFSFWWMTQLAEKSPFKSPRLFSCLRLLALEDMLLADKPSELTLNSADRDLADAISELCRNLDINFMWPARSNSERRMSLRRLYQALPYCVRGLLSFRHLVKRWRLRSVKKPHWFSSDNSVFFCSYLFNLDPALGEHGQFHPRQWEGLPEYLTRNGKRANWIHHFLPSPAIPDPATGLKWVGLFNRDPERQGNHRFIETYLTWRLVLRAAKSWLWLNLVYWRLRHIRAAFTPKASAVSLWPFLRHDWGMSLAGSVAVNNCLWMELFDAVMKEMPHQRIGFYIWENQGWECALLRAWRRYRHGKLIGAPHATVVYWHLNNFDDPRAIGANEKWSKPVPDELAVNGRMARDAFLATGYPVARLVDVEALRFQYLTGIVKNKSAQSCNDGAKLQKKVLILGDFTIAQTLRMLECIEAALHMTDAKMLVTLKPHPVCPIKNKDFPKLDFQLTERTLSEIVEDFDVAFSSNTSSAGLDALLAGLSVVVFLDESELNLSPLRGIPDIQFATTPKELAVALQAERRNASPPAASDFFCLDGALPKWGRLLTESTGT